MRLRATILACAMLSFVGCAAPGSEIALAPAYSRYTTADGGVEWEALGGLYRRRHTRTMTGEAGRFESLTVGPIWSVDPGPAGSWRQHFLVPLGYARREADEAISFLLPFYLWQRAEKADGSTEWGLAALPGLLLLGNSKTGVEAGWFPFVGRFENIATFDKIVFVLWPLYVYVRRGENVSRHFLYPIFGWTRGGEETSEHFWPFYGRSRIEDRYDRTFVLWPFFHHHRNFLGGGGEQPETSWMVFPFYGHSSRGTFEAHTALWPLFGYSKDPERNFWAVDAPWFLVRLQRGPGDFERTRFWPIWSHMKSDTLEATNWLWPIVHIRRETYTTSVRDSIYVVPLWQSWDRTDLETGEQSRWRKLWPLFQFEGRDRWRRGSFPTLDPFQRNELIDRHYSWIWKVWEWEAEDQMRRERSWLGLWRREKDAGEERASLSGLWSGRRYHEEGRKVSETSLLFGLLRWRVTEGEGFSMLRPAFPGPGWPAHRKPALEASGEPREARYVGTH